MSDPASIWSPLRIGATEVSHRIMVTGHSPYYAKDNLLSDRHIAYYTERAKGGVALQITAGHAAHWLSKGTGTVGAVAWDERAIPQFARLAESIHAHDSRIFVQLFAPGARDRGTDNIDHFHELWSPSAIPSAGDGEMPVAMDQAQIDDVIAGFAASAANVKAGGLDGVEIHAAHSSSLVGYFMNPVYNRRDDDYGGAAASRCRFPLEIGRAIRAEVGDDFTIGIRISFEEFVGDAGITQEQAEVQLETMAAAGVFDFFDISGGSYATLHLGVASMTVEDGYMIPFGKRAKEIVGEQAKVFIVGRIREVEQAEQVIADGAADMVGMTRAHIADPFLVSKARAGRSDEITRCAGVNECVARIAEARPMICMMNPATGREQALGDGTFERVEPSEAKRVAVAGGGPAGLKVAAVAAARGHEVVLLEQSEELGGHLNQLKRLPTRGGWQTVIDNLRGAAERAGVAVRLETRAAPRELAADGLDALICATGSRYDSTGFTPFRPDRDGIPGADGSRTLPLDAAVARALEDPGALGSRVIIVDENGFYLPLGLAEILAEHGVEVEVVTRQLTVGHHNLITLEAGHLYPRLAELGVRMTAQHFVEEIRGDEVELYDIWGGPRRTVSGVDTVVLSMLRSAESELYEQSQGHFEQVERIGDALAPRTPTMAIYEGEKLGRSL